MRERPAASAPPDAIHSNRCLALAQLLAAHDVARETGRNPWAYACQIMALQNGGVTDTTLRWLVHQALAEHRLETTKPKDRQRRFKPVHNDHFTAQSSFCLTSSGVFAAREAAGRDDNDVPLTRMPRYDIARRTLFLGNTIVKQLRVPARNQELVLKAFQLAGWPARMENPFRSTKDTDRKKRLHDVIHRLNHRQTYPLIRFSGDGTGSGILWQVCELPIAER